MKRAAAIVALTLASGGAAVPAAARDLVVVRRSENHNVLLLDRDSIRPADDDTPDGPRRAVLSIDNSASPDSVHLYAADIGAEADCAGGQLAILWSRAYAPDGSLAASAAAAVPHDFVRPDTPMERAALKAICETK